MTKEEEVKKLNLDNEDLILRLVKEKEERPSVGDFSANLRSDIMDRAAEMQDAPRNTCFMEVRNSGPYRAKSFYLSRDDEWEIIKDSEGAHCLIPKLKT